MTHMSPTQHILCHFKVYKSTDNDRFCRILIDKGHVVWDWYGCNLRAYWLKLHMCKLVLIDSRRMF